MKGVWVSFILILISTILASAPCFSATPLKLEFWHSMGGEKGRLIKKIVEDFNARSENQGRILIESQYVGNYDEGLNKLRTALLGEAGPHIVQVTDIGQRVMVDSQKITPLQEFIDRDPEFPIAQLLPAIRNYYEIHGRLYSLPFATSNPIVYYNVDLFRKAGLTHPPGTFTELLEMSRKLSDPRAHTYGISWPLNSWFYEEFLARQGAVLLTPENGRKTRAQQANYLSKESIDFVTLWARMVKEGSFANVGRGWDPPEQNFLAGRIAMFITSTSDIFEIYHDAKFNVATAPIPAPDHACVGGTIVGGNSLWIMNTKPREEQQAAYEFVKYMASPEVQEKWHTHTGYFPIRTDVIAALKAKGFYEKYPLAWTAIEQLRAAPVNVATQGGLTGVFPELREQIATAIEEVLSGQLDVRAALSKAKSEADFSLLRYNRGKEE